MLYRLTTRRWIQFLAIALTIGTIVSCAESKERVEDHNPENRSTPTPETFDQPRVTPTPPLVIFSLTLASSLDLLNDEALGLEFEHDWFNEQDHWIAHYSFGSQHSFELSGYFNTVHLSGPSDRLEVASLWFTWEPETKVQSEIHLYFFLKLFYLWEDSMMWVKENLAAAQAGSQVDLIIHNMQIFLKYEAEYSQHVLIVYIL